MGDFFRGLFGVFQWAIAIVSVAATLALFGWIVAMVVRKDKPE
jgi:hypothetical protein